jgi:hypothetical protein
MKMNPRVNVKVKEEQPSHAHDDNMCMCMHMNDNSIIDINMTTNDDTMAYHHDRMGIECSGNLSAYAMLSLAL